jgi:hypothetical protein
MRLSGCRYTIDHLVVLTLLRGDLAAVPCALYHGGGKGPFGGSLD